LSIALSESPATNDLSIYIHWPFCEAKCPYCDFNSYVASSIDHNAWADAFCSALEHQAKFSRDRLIHTIYFGGGTPSLMEPRIVELILNKISKEWRFKNNVEITLEANPSSVEQSKFSNFRKAGINRVSLGVQALNDEDLKRLGRLHSVSDALQALDIAATTFDRCSFDLIYARQDQKLQDWEQELTRALTFGFSHMSLYSLTIEAGTAFGDRFEKGRLKGLPNEDIQTDMFKLTHDLCAAYGLTAYEVSNYSKDGERSYHNMVYWAGGDYLGIGPGAHGRFSESSGARWASETELNPMKWLNSTENTIWEKLTNEDHAIELISMGLRCTDGIDLSLIYSKTGFYIPQTSLDELLSYGAIKQSNQRVWVASEWFSLLNQIVLKLLS
jgi:putative oxygen-independent coproporphyrinogen III oxidase